MTNNDSLVAFILTHGRPNNVVTYKTLKNSGYTGEIYLIVDDLDKTKDEYIKLYKEKVIVFDKIKTAEEFDECDNFKDMRSIFYARNACFKIAKGLGIKYFIQLDDDYTSFQYRFNKNLDYEYKLLKNLDTVFKELLEFFKNTNIKSIAFAQGGDFIGGSGNNYANKVTLKRKCMNSFICSTDKPFEFIGKINEDVNTYTKMASIGNIFFTTNQVLLNQGQTQKNKGGMSELYLDSGTYIKSFYSVMVQPSSVKVGLMNHKNPRLHHSVDWDYTVPKILSE